MPYGHNIWVNVIAPRTLAAFWAVHPEAEDALREWLRHVQRSDYSNFAEVRAEYGSADWVEGLIVFNIGGNKYRLIVSPNFGPHYRTFFIRAVLTHRQYDHWAP